MSQQLSCGGEVLCGFDSLWLVPVQVGGDERRAQVGGGLGQAQGEDGVLQPLDGGTVDDGRQAVECVEQRGDVRVVQHHVFLLHLLQDVHRIFMRGKTFKGQKERKKKDMVSNDP